MLFIPIALALLTSVMALPQPLPSPLDAIPTLTTANFAKTSKKASGTKTTKLDDSGGGGGVTTKIINHTVTTGKYRSKSSKPALVSGKLAGIIIASIVGAILLLVLAAFLYKRHKRKQAALHPKQPNEEEEVGVEDKENDKEVEAAPVVTGEMAYGSQPAIPRSNGDLGTQQPKVVGLGADGVVASSAK